MILAIDPGSTCAGWSTFRLTKLSGEAGKRAVVQFDLDSCGLLRWKTHEELVEQFELFKEGANADEDGPRAVAAQLDRAEEPVRDPAGAVEVNLLGDQGVGAGRVSLRRAHQVPLPVALGLVALLAVGGLIPFWIYIFFLYNPR